MLNNPYFIDMLTIISFIAIITFISKQYQVFKNIQLKNLFTLLIIIIAIIAIAIIFFYFNSFETIFPTDTDQDLRGAFGAFGDYFGGLLNPLVGGISVYLIYITWQMSRKEFKATRKEMALQTFDNHFFQVIGIWENLINSLEIYEKGKNYKGRAVIRQIPDDYFSREYDKNIENENNVVKEFQLIQSQYFSLIFQLLLLIDGIDFIEDKIEKVKVKKRYILILKSILTTKDLSIIIYDLSLKSEIYNLINEYCLFENITKDLLKNKTFDDGTQNAVKYTTKEAFCNNEDIWKIWQQNINRQAYP